MKTKYFFGLLYLVLIFLSFNFVSSFEVQTLNGSTMEWNQSFCLNDPANYRDSVGDDYYLYCGPNFEEGYDASSDGYVPYLDKPIIAPNNSINRSTENKNVVDENQTFPLKNSTDLADNILSDEKDNVPNNNWQLFAGIVGIILLLIVVILIMAHQLAIKRDEKKQLINLTPYINNLKKNGYSESQLEEFLIKRGYESSFINKLLNKK